MESQRRKYIKSLVNKHECGLLLFLFGNELSPVTSLLQSPALEKYTFVSSMINSM